MSKVIKILIVDDDQVFCQLLEKGLNRLGYQSSTAFNGTQALKARLPIDVILLDMRLGDESGLGLIQPLLENHPKAKIIVITGYASLATAVDAIKQGAVNYIAKPIDVKSVHKVIQDSLSDDHSSEEQLQAETNASSETPFSLKRLEWEHIQRVLEENNGNISQTANQLGMHRRTLQRKLKKHAPTA